MRRMKRSNEGTVKAVSPRAALQTMPFERRYEAGKCPPGARHAITQSLLAGQPKQRPVQLGSEQRGNEAPLRGLDHDGGESVRMCPIMYALEQNGLSDTAKTEQKLAPRGQMPPRPFCGDVDRLEQFVSPGKLGGWSARARPHLGR